MSDWLIYGANGYTGTLIAKEAVAEMATRLGLPHRVFGLDDAAVREGCSGPCRRRGGRAPSTSGVAQSPP